MLQSNKYINFKNKTIIIYISSQDLWWTIQAHLFLNIAPQPKQQAEQSVTAFDLLGPLTI